MSDLLHRLRRLGPPTSGWTRRVEVGGSMISLAGVVILLGIITAETQYPKSPGYNTFSNDISDLGGTVPPHSFITQPAAQIFDWTMIVAGIMLIVGAFLVHEVHRRRLLTIPSVLLGIGVLGVGVFPGNVATIHPLFALCAFFFGGIAAVCSGVVVGKSMFRYIAPVLGGTSLFFLLVGPSTLNGTLGTGGVERWIAYPVVMWMVLYGGYVLGIGQGRFTPSPQVNDSRKDQP